MPNFKPKKGKLLKKIQPVFLLLAIIITGVFVWSLFNSTSSVFNFALPLVGGSQLKSTDDRVNVLMLGLAGGKHDGALLTDSIIVASYHLKTNRAVMFSLPRDLWLDSVDAKVNAAYEFGFYDKNGGNGLKFAEDKIGEVLGIPIHYGVRIDFSGFERAIDLVGGVDVEVPKTFDDYNYPVTGKEDDLCGNVEKELEFDEAKIKEIDPEGKLGLKPGKNKVIVGANDKIASEAADFACRFERLHFDKGVSRMNGETALKFVRSRMGTNGEGSDFARSRRQQLVINAFREKALSAETIFNPSKISGLLTTFGESFETDIEASRYLDFYNLVKKMERVESIVLGDLGNGKSILKTGAPSKYGAFVLVPNDERAETIHEFVRQKLAEDLAAAESEKQNK